MSDHNLRLPVLVSDTFLPAAIWDILDDRFALPGKAKEGDILGISMPVLYDAHPVLLPITNLLVMQAHGIAESDAFTDQPEAQQNIYGAAIVHIQSAFEGLSEMQKLLNKMVSHDIEADWLQLHIIRGAALFTFEHHVNEIFEGRYHDATESTQKHLDEAMRMILPSPHSNHDRINWTKRANACADIFCKMMPFPDAESREWINPKRPDFQNLQR